MSRHVLPPHYSVERSSCRAATLRRLIHRGLDEGLFLGAAYRVFRAPDEVLAEGAAGLAQERPEVPAGAHTAWDLASITKPAATATAILMLAEQGELHLDEEVSHFLRGDRLGCGDSLEGITLRHCLTHTSGLKNCVTYHSQGWSRDQIVQQVRREERCRRPGTGYEYSDLGYILLGEVVTAVSGLCLSEFCAEKIFGPLGMRDTAFCPPASWQPRLAATRCRHRGRVLLGEVHDGNAHDMGGVAGHAGLFSTLDDLTRYAQMVLNGGELEGARILSPLSIRQMARNQNPPGISGHTLGWFTRPNGFFPCGDLLPEDAYGHTGFTGTSMLLIPSMGVGIILLTNRVYMQRDAGDFLRFRRRFHNAVASLL